MTKYKVTVQILKDFELEAESVDEAKKKAETEARSNLAGGSPSEIKPTGEVRIFAQEPKDLDKARHMASVAKEKKK